MKNNSSLLLGKPHNPVVFLDVDGCVFDFEKLLTARMRLYGLVPPTPSQMASRLHDYISEAFPGVVGRELESQLVGEVFLAGSLKTQDSYDCLNKALLSRLLAQPNVVILTKLDPDFAADRHLCFLNHFGVDLTGKLFTVWGKTTKGERMKQYCEEYGLDLAQTTLVDDRHDNLETAMRLGARGLLVERSYNESHRDRLTAEYGSLYASTPHNLMAESIQEIASAAVTAEVLTAA